MINVIEMAAINKGGKYLDKNNNKLEYLYNLNKINIFVGENNSGKSRLMRLLINNTNDVNIFTNDQINFEYQKRIVDILQNINLYAEKLDYGTWSEKLAYKNGENIGNYYARIKETMSKYENVFNNETSTMMYNFKTNINTLHQLLNNIYDSHSYSDYKRIYVPILRGIENFDVYFNDKNNIEILSSIMMNDSQRKALDNYKDNSKRIYKNKVSQTYDIDDANIFTGENLYEDIAKKLLGKKEDRELINEFQEFISKYFYDGKEFEIIPQMSDKVVDVKIDRIEHELHNLGDGIKQMITILYPIFTRKDGEYLFFIEEPEINLHPGFQRKLIEIFQLDIFKNHQYFITTHSNHLIDSCLDYDCISLYKFINHKNDKFSVINTTKNDIDMLNLLGVNNSSVFMANCTIWVEGISDKILIKKYLDVYLGDNNKYKEDIDYSFVEYGGNNITHWSFDGTDDIDKINASGITNRSFIIVDNDNGNKVERKEQLKEIFNENYYELNVREIENTISKSILNKAFIDDSHPIKEEFEENEYQNTSTYMGDFIDNHYNYKKKWSNKDKNGYGTGSVNNKLEFSKLISNNINKKEDLSLEAITICEKIEKFIKESSK